MADPQRERSGGKLQDVPPVSGAHLDPGRGALRPQEKETTVKIDATGLRWGDRQPRLGEGEGPLPTPAERLLIDVAAAAEMLTVSVPTLRRMISAGRTPQPVRLGRALRFRRSDLLQWIDAGCPSRREVRR